MAGSHSKPGVSLINRHLQGSPEDPQNARGGEICKALIFPYKQMETGSQGESVLILISPYLQSVFIKPHLSSQACRDGNIQVCLEPQTRLNSFDCCILRTEPMIFTPSCTPSSDPKGSDSFGRHSIYASCWLQKKNSRTF